MLYDDLFKLPIWHLYKPGPKPPLLNGWKNNCRTYEELRPSGEFIPVARMGLTPKGLLYAVDLDNALRDGFPTSWAAFFLETLPPTYVEVSRSGKGLHAIYLDATKTELVKGSKFSASKSLAKWELLTNYALFTGPAWGTKHYEGPREIAELPVERARLFLKKGEQLMRNWITALKAGHPLIDAWFGDPSSYDGDASSRDMAIFNHLKVLRDRELIKRVAFRSPAARVGGSPPKGRKWERKDYIDGLLDKALEDVSLTIWERLENRREVKMEVIKEGVLWRGVRTPWVGSSNAGKSRDVADMLGRGLAGEPQPDGLSMKRISCVWWCAFESGGRRADKVQRIFSHYGVNDQVLYFYTAKDLDAAIEAYDEVPPERVPDVIVIDTITHWRPADSNQIAKVQEIILGMEKMGEMTNAAIIDIHHPTKSFAADTNDYRQVIENLKRYGPSGSLAWTSSVNTWMGVLSLGRGRFIRFQGKEDRIVVPELFGFHGDPIFYSKTSAGLPDPLLDLRLEIADREVSFFEAVKIWQKIVPMDQEVILSRIRKACAFKISKEKNISTVSPEEALLAALDYDPHHRPAHEVLLELSEGGFTAREINGASQRLEEEGKLVKRSMAWAKVHEERVSQPQEEDRAEDGPTDSRRFFE